MIHKNAFFRVSRTSRALRIEVVNPEETVDEIETCNVASIMAFCKKYPQITVAIPSLALHSATSKKKVVHPANQRLAEIAEVEALKGHSLVDADCYVWKTYIEPLIPAMQSLGHIGNEYIHFNWCACFVHSVMHMADLPLPAIPEVQGAKFWASSALCEAIEWYAKQTGCYIKNRLTTRAERGWIVFFDWDNNEREDHIGIVLADEGGLLMTAEGNHKNHCAIKKRSKIPVSGYADFSSLGALTV